MGKNLENENSGVSVQSSGPRYKWGVLHILKYHHWRYIKKKFPYKRPIDGKNGTRKPKNGTRHDIKASRDDGMWRDDSTRSDEIFPDDKKMAKPTPATKSSVKSRLKSLISEELYSIRSRHSRTSSCPIQPSLTQTDSTHRLELSEQDTPAAMIINSETPTMTDDDSEDQSLEDFSTNVDAKDTANPDGEHQNLMHAKELNKAGSSSSCHSKEISEFNASGEHQNLMHAKELNKDGSSCHSKEISDARDIINMNKDFFLKVLQDPGSPLAQHFHTQQALSSRMAYSKSLSFSSSSFSVRASELRKLRSQKEITESDTVKPKSKAYNRSESMPSIPIEYQTIRPRKNQAVIKRFRNLKDKIKHVIRQNKNEKLRIAMDGILHRIPSGHGIPKDLKSDTRSSIDGNDSPRSSCESHHSVHSTYNKTGSRRISRTASLNESLDKYCQLYESSCKAEPKQHHHFEPLKLRIEDSSQTSASNSMRRLFSSPDLKSYFCYNEDSSDSFPSGQVRYAAGATMSTRSDISEQSDAKSSIRSEIQHNLDADRISVDEGRQKIETISNIGKDAKSDINFEDLELPGTKCQEENASPATLSSDEEADLTLTISLPLREESDYMEDQQAETTEKEKPEVAESGIEKTEIPSKHMIQVEVGAKDKTEFDYVKDILELSGFSKNETLGTWHSDEQPMDPCLFDQVGAGSILLDPDQDCLSRNEQLLSPYPCYHLLLFDLINEVLMEIYARSYTYCPMALSTLSNIRPLPAGHHVLEEVWTCISSYLSSSIPDSDQLLDYIVSRDLAKYDGWMNLQFECECVGLEVEDIIFYDLLDEVICI